MEKRTKVHLSDESAEQLEALALKVQEESGRAVVSKQVKLFLALEALKSTPYPLTAVYDGLEIRNRAAIEFEKQTKEFQRTPMKNEEELIEQLADIKAKTKTIKISFLKRFYRALEIKPNFAGIGIDLKKLIDDDGS